MEIRGNRIAELDGLRGIAAILVVLYHYTTRFSAKFNIGILSDITFFKYGHYGVQMFFVLSGFVIFMAITKINSSFEFACKRFIRLYPTFWLCVLVTTLFVNFFGPNVLKVSLDDFVGNLTMIPHALNFKFVDGVYWTLQIELCFYAFTMLLIFARSTQYITIVGLLYIIIGFLLYYFFRLFPYYHHGLLFFAGIQFYKLWQGNKNWYPHFSLILVLVLSFLYRGFEFGACISLIFCIFYLLIYEKLNFLSLPVFVFLGKISYAFYLLHQNIGYSIQLFLVQNDITNKIYLVVVPFFITLFISSVVTFLFEQKVLKMLNTFYKVRFSTVSGNNRKADKTEVIPKCRIKPNFLL